MPNKKSSLPAPRFEMWKNPKTKELGYHTIGINRTKIGGEENQGFKRFAGIEKNIKANALIFGVKLKFCKCPKTEDQLYGIFQDTASDLEVPVYLIS